MSAADGPRIRFVSYYLIFNSVFWRVPPLTPPSCLSFSAFACGLDFLPFLDGAIIPRFRCTSNWYESWAFASPVTLPRRNSPTDFHGSATNQKETGRNSAAVYIRCQRLFGRCWTRERSERFLRIHRERKSSLTSLTKSIKTGFVRIPGCQQRSRSIRFPAPPSSKSTTL